MGPVSMRLVLRGIEAGKIPRDSEARRADERSWRNLMDVVVAVASALLEEQELGAPPNLSDEEKTLIAESPFAQRPSAPAMAARAPAVPPPVPTTRRRPRR